ncbi:MAG: NAD(P)-binding protein [Pseudolabrys sp.]
MAKLKVLVAGGGIGGIASVLALRQRGFDVQLFEQAAAFGMVGAGIQVSSNAAKILLKLGLGEALKKVATYPEGRDYRGWDTAERLYYTPLGRESRSAFRLALLRRAPRRIARRSAQRSSASTGVQARFAHRARRPGRQRSFR